MVPQVEGELVDAKGVEVLYSQRSQLSWKERGRGDAKLLLHRKISIVQFTLQQEKAMERISSSGMLPATANCSHMLAVTSLGKGGPSTSPAQNQGQNSFVLKFASTVLLAKVKDTFEVAKRLNQARHKSVQGMG